MWQWKGYHIHMGCSVCCRLQLVGCVHSLKNKQTFRLLSDTMLWGSCKNDGLSWGQWRHCDAGKSQVYFDGSLTMPGHRSLPWQPRPLKITFRSQRKYLHCVKWSCPQLTSCYIFCFMPVGANDEIILVLKLSAKLSWTFDRNRCVEASGKKHTLF